MDIPRNREVSNDRFGLLTSSGKIVNWETSERYARPGVTVFLSIEKTMLLGEQGHCPRCWEMEINSTCLTFERSDLVVQWFGATFGLLLFLT